MTEGGEIQVSINRRAVARTACAGTLILLVCAGATFAVWPDRLPSIAFGFCSVVYLLVVVSTVRLLFVWNPYLLVSDEGISIQDPLINGAMISWPEIQDLRVYSNDKGNLIIVLRHPNDILTRQNRVQRLYVRLNMRGSHALTVPAAYFSISPIDLFTQITQRYASQLAQYQASISDRRRWRNWTAAQGQGQ